MRESCNDDDIPDSLPRFFLHSGLCLRVRTSGLAQQSSLLGERELSHWGVSDRDRNQVIADEEAGRLGQVMWLKESIRGGFGSEAGQGFWKGDGRSNAWRDCSRP